jgi:hypothetical protein
LIGELISSIGLIKTNVTLVIELITFLVIVLVSLIIFYRYVLQNKFDSIDRAFHQIRIDGEKVKYELSQVIKQALEAPINAISSLKEMLVAHEKNLESVKDVVYSMKGKLPDTKTDQIEYISEVVRKSAISTTNAVYKYYLECRKDNIIPDRKVSGEIAYADVQNDRETFHNLAISNGISPMLMNIWEETEALLFPAFIYRFEQFTDVVNAMNGSYNEAKIRSDLDLLAVDLHKQFMGVIVNKVVSR